MSGGNGPLKVKICLITGTAKIKPMLIHFIYNSILPKYLIRIIYRIYIFALIFAIARFSYLIIDES